MDKKCISFYFYEDNQGITFGVYTHLVVFFYIFLLTFEENIPLTFPRNRGILNYVSVRIALFHDLFIREVPRIRLSKTILEHISLLSLSETACFWPDKPTDLEKQKQKSKAHA